jgi:nucleotide-binding universal stress UspA family protein
MAAVVWVVEGTWQACVDAARSFVPEPIEIVLLHVTSRDISSVAHAAYSNLLGRAEPKRDPGTSLEHLAADYAGSLLHDAAARLGRPCRTEERVGQIEQEVVAAAEMADLLIVARDGERREAGPKSLGHAGRFVLDHASCPVLLVWPSPHALA